MPKITDDKALVKLKFNYCESEIEDVFQKLISNWPELIDFYNLDVIFQYNVGEERINYSDIGDISNFIVEKKMSGETDHFDQFFDFVEEVLSQGDDYVQNLIVVGLFEGIQNIGGSKIDYYRSFDQWLKPNSLKAWRDLIDSWEGEDWKKTSESERIMNKKKRH